MLLRIRTMLLNLPSNENTQNMILSLQLKILAEPTKKIKIILKNRQKTRIKTLNLFIVGKKIMMIVQQLLL